MAKITEFDRAESASSTDIFLIDSTIDTSEDNYPGTRTVSYSDVIASIMDELDVDSMPFNTIDYGSLTTKEPLSTDSTSDIQIGIEFNVEFASSPTVFYNVVNCPFPVTLTSTSTTGAELAVKRGFLVDDTEIYTAGATVTWMAVGDV